MKKILFIINSLNVGGAEKSLVSLLNLLPKDEYKIDLYLLRKRGIFIQQVPECVTIKEVPFPYTCLSRKVSDFKFFLKNGLIWWIKKIYRRYLVKQLKKKQQGSTIQLLWNRWKDDIPTLTAEYDVAISYIEGSTNYFIIDKVRAKKKVLWMHTIYDKWGYSPEFDKYYFEKADKVVTISNICKESLEKNFPYIDSNKFMVLENLTSKELITSLSKEELDDSLFKTNKKKKILSVGRLDPIKAYDLALKAAKELKDNGEDFIWYIVGDGKIREELEKLKTNLELDNYVYFVGSQINPYKYMRYADVIVQSSKYEGKSIVLDEAKLLGKPIVATNYSTVADAITDRVTGIITEMTPESLANGISEMLSDDHLRDNITANIKAMVKDNTDQLNEYINILN